MKEHYFLLIAAIPLSILIWIGMKIYLDPGERTHWVLESEPVATDKSKPKTAKSEEQKVDKTAQTNQSQQKRSSRSDEKKAEGSPNTKLEDVQLEALKQPTEVTPQQREKENSSESELIELLQDSNDNEPQETESQPANTASNNQSATTTEQAPSTTTQSNRITTTEEIVTGEEHGVTVAGAHNDANCVERFSPYISVNVLFRVKSAAIKSVSLTELNEVIAAYRECASLKVTVETSDITKKLSKSLQRRRVDEVKYHLIHQQISKSDIVLPDKL